MHPWRMHPWRARPVVVSAALFAVAACNGSSHGAASSPTALCKAALGHKVIASATGTTVGAVRALPGGPPGARIASHAFPGADSSAPAAWCWVASGVHSWTAYAVGPRHESMQIASYDGLITAPSGAPAIK